MFTQVSPIQVVFLGAFKEDDVTNQLHFDYHCKSKNLVCAITTIETVASEMRTSTTAILAFRDFFGEEELEELTGWTDDKEIETFLSKVMYPKVRLIHFV